MNKRPYFSHSVVMMSHVQISVSVDRTTRLAATPPESSKDRRKLILNGVSISSLAKVASFGIVARKANTAAIWIKKKTREASNRKRSRLAISIGVSLAPPTSNSTR